jgi:hypothetical protein
MSHRNFAREQWVRGFSLDNDRSPEPERDLGREKIALTSENHSVSKLLF